ncbi:AAA family ATPase [Thermococcus aciditolerans]|uniref:ATP-binding protein n=1 Tax=Thermococcus aciditolerans TaxID=2598455 RepID=A0A5C0SLS4_9EURY|nr:ATP-binding protein [Thermococcus aciditolerans]QEK14942.1 ATP-binding protein [Thermococcus aciditolerans]
MLFDVQPKTSIDELFGRRAEYLSFLDAIEKRRNFFIITGPRRIGKTSFLYAALNELEQEYGIPYAVIDARAATSLNSKYPQRIIAERLYKAISRKGFVGGVISRIKGIRISGIEVELQEKGFDIVDVLSAINEGNELAVIAFDEAQYLRFSNEDLTKLFAWVLDSLHNIVLVFTGSQVGVLENFLRLDEGDSPLFGRYEVRISLPRFNPSESLEFLRRGFEEYGIDVNERELLPVVNTLDGVPGWLVHYGAHRIDGLTNEEAIEKVLEKAMKYVQTEFEELDKLSPRYRVVVRAIAWLSEGRGYARWERIKGLVEEELEEKIDEKAMRGYLSKLMDYGFVETIGYGKYRIPDPVMYRVFRRM